MTPLSDGIYITSDEHPEHVYRVDTATGKGYGIHKDGRDDPIPLDCFYVEDGYKVVAAPGKPKFKVGDYADLYHSQGTKLVALCRIIEGDQFELVEVERGSYLTVGGKYRIKREDLRSTDRRPKPKPKPHEIPGTLLRSPNTGNIVKVRSDGRLSCVHVGEGYGPPPGEIISATGVFPSLAKWTPVKAVTKTEYVPV